MAKNPVLKTKTYGHWKKYVAILRRHENKGTLTAEEALKQTFKFMEKQWMFGTARAEDVSRRSVAAIITKEK